MAIKNTIYQMVWTQTNACTETQDSGFYNSWKELNIDGQQMCKEHGRQAAFKKMGGKRTELAYRVNESIVI
jgi:hypothetical protein